MRTFNDLLEVGENEANRMQFVYEAINEHKSSDLYKTAQIADEYDRKQNRTIVQFQKLLYDATGRAIPDNVSANYKITSGFFNRFTTQQVQFLLGNGVTWEDETTKDYLGQDFDKQLQVAAKASLGAGVSFGFYNYDHLEVFSALEYVPLYDEEKGALMAGIRFWQVDAQKPLRATLYEIDGITEYIWEDGEGRILKGKRPYILTLISTGVDEAEIFAGENYPTFPIVPLWANPHKQSELVGLREQIDAYDLIKSGFCNTIDEASFIYWTINNAGGMDEIDLAEFVQRLKTIHAANMEDTGATAQANTLEAPHEGREALLDRLAKDMYADYMALNIDEIKGGANTATQIRAAYEPMNNKADQFEYCVLEFLQGILSVAGIEDKPTFTRSYLVNTQEEISILLQASQYLDDEYVTRKILTLLGDADKADEIIASMEEYDYKRMAGEEPPEEEVIE
jgi:SPP1 family phage portal protein